MTRAVIVQMTTVSMNGSSSPTNPSLTGSAVRAVAWAMAALPSPASFEKAARRNPMTSAPSMPPAIPSGANAPCQMAATAPGSRSACRTRTRRASAT